MCTARDLLVDAYALHVHCMYTARIHCIHCMLTAPTLASLARLQATQRLLMSGTPVQNSLGELLTITLTLILSHLALSHLALPLPLTPTPTPNPYPYP